MTDSTQLNDALAANYLLVDLDLHSWSGNKTDREASSEIIAAKGATRDSGKFVKFLLAGADAELQAVQRAGTALKTFVKQNTVAFQGSYRLLLATKAIAFLADLNALKTEYDAAVLTLESVWDQRVVQAKSNLGGLAADEYPRADQVRKLYGMNIDVRPVPSESDFSRINLPAELIAALGQRHATQLETQMASVYGDLKVGLLKELQRMAQQLGKAGRGEKTKLYDTLVTNMQRQVTMLRDMNAAGKPEINALADKIEQELLAQPVEAFRNSQAAAALVAQKAEAIAVDAAMESVWQL
jgi:hypothetical protein